MPRKPRNHLAVFDQASLAQVSTEVAKPGPFVGQPPLDESKHAPDVEETDVYVNDDGVKVRRTIRNGRVVREELAQ